VLNSDQYALEKKAGLSVVSWNRDAILRPSSDWMTQLINVIIIIITIIIQGGPKKW